MQEKKRKRHPTWSFTKPDPDTPARIIHTVYAGSGMDVQKRNPSQ